MPPQTEAPKAGESRDGIWRGVFPPQPGERRDGLELPPRGPGLETHFAYFEGHRTPLLRLYADALSSSNSVSFHITYQLNCCKLVTEIVGGKAEVCGGGQVPLLPQRRTAPEELYSHKLQNLGECKCCIKCVE